jgi:hypothetical protein
MGFASALPILRHHGAAASLLTRRRRRVIEAENTPEDRNG